MKSTPVISIICALLLMASCKHDTREALSPTKAAIKVEAHTVGTGNKENTLKYSGLVLPKISTQLSFQVPGSVESVRVDVGDKIKKGNVLARISGTSFQSSLDAAIALEKQAIDAHQRLKKVYDNGSLPEIKWVEVNSKLEQAKASVRIARNQLENCALIAPSDGVIGQRNLEIGTTVIPGINVMELYKIDQLYIKIPVPENEINLLEIGQNAQIRINALGDSYFEGTVEKIGVSADPFSRTYEVKILLDNPELKIKPGMVCDVDVMVPKTSSGLSIPSQAVIKDKDGSCYVFVIDPKNKTAKKQKVECGIFIDNMLEIKSGLKPGQLIAVRGQHKLQDNSTVAL